MSKLVKMSKLVRLPDGSKARVQSVSTFFGETIVKTKKGFMYRYNLYANLFDIEEEIIQKLYLQNSRRSLRFREGTICRDKAYSLKECWSWRLEENEPMDFKEDSTLAVACRLDNLGNIMDFLSITEWASVHHFQVPEGWHYFLPINI